MLSVPLRDIRWHISAVWGLASFHRLMPGSQVVDATVERNRNEVEVSRVFSRKISLFFSRSFS